MEEDILNEGYTYAYNNYINELGGHLSVDKKFINTHLNLDNSKILDFGCGMGGMTLWFAKNYNCNVIGVDLDSNHIEIAHKLHSDYPNPKVKFILGNILELDIKEKFDYIILNDVIEHLPLNGIENILITLSQKLSKRGRIYIGYPPWESPYASHLNSVIKIYWCQFLPKKFLIYLLKKFNKKIVGKNESDLLQAYHGLNKMNIRNDTTKVF